MDDSVTPDHFDENNPSKDDTGGSDTGCSGLKYFDCGRRRLADTLFEIQNIV